ncbi:MAG: glycosyltransferase family 39 protein [Hyphomicrobiaceae bacterium]|nr:glycosyltransferase family 39 protein [Hyphomicrobiaceae bacterium]
MDNTAGSARSLSALAARPGLAALVLVALCLITYLPGVLRLPAVDRTEVIFAETTRAMVARGAWLDPKYGDTIHQFRPIGTFWAQGLAASLAGENHARDIRVYRLPGLLAVLFSVLALFWLASPVVGREGALIASGLFAVAPLTVALSQLAIADGLALLPASVAMLALLRIYSAPEETDTLRLALLVWAAVGLGMLVNALHTPILICVTLIALSFMDRDFWWLGRLHPAKGVLLAAIIAAPWLVVRTLQDGVPFAGMSLGKFLAALGGAQDMKLRAFPGTFLLAAVLGFLPGTALLPPALRKLWEQKSDSKLARFLIAWIFGYIVYLELLSSKPGTYTVQVMFPAMALAVAMLVLARDQQGAPAWSAIPWPPLAALFGFALVMAPFVALRDMPPVYAMLAAAVVAAFFYVSAQAGRSGGLRDWGLYGVMALSALAVVLLGVAMPSIDKIWPTRQITRALAGCPAGPIAVQGYREPSAGFVLAPDPQITQPDAIRTALVDGRPSYIVGEVRDESLGMLSRMQYRRPRTLGCVEALNVMRGCPLYFTILATGPLEGCTARETYACSAHFQEKAALAKEKPGCE